MRIVFMGTPQIACTALDALLREGHELAAVYTRLDKPVGRRQIITPPPVKVAAQQNGIPVQQPATLRGGGAVAAYAPELVVVVAYGLILPPEVLAAPKYGCVNLHVSLLPKYRGAAPIQRALINGERETGVCVMQMDEGLDTGPILGCQTIAIPREADAGELFGQAAAVGARLLADTVADIAAGRAKATPQQGAASYAPRLNKSEARLNFGLAAQKAHNLVRGCNPWPLAWFVYEGRRVKVLRASALEQSGGVPGEMLGVSPLVVACGEGALVLEQVHPEGGRPMAGAEWAAGRRLKAGAMVRP